MDTKHLVIDGYADAKPTPGAGPGIAHFDLIHSPANAEQIAPDTPDTVFACTTGDPRIADALLREIQPGDLLRVTGTLFQPGAPEAPGRVTVDALEVLKAAPVPVLYDLVLERYGRYLVVFDASTDTVPVFAETGAWVGEAASPEAITDVIDAYENGGGLR